MQQLLKEIEFGEPDANAEYFMSLRLKNKPMYIRAYHSDDMIDYDSYISGVKFIITGQKGTGKTAVLRYIEDKLLESGYSTEFIVFKNEVIKEAELLQIDYANINGTVLEEEKLKGSKFYYHSIKRIMISLIISKLKYHSDNSNDQSDGFIRSLIGQNGKESLRTAFDSIVNLLQSAKLDTAKATKGLVSVDPGQLLKKSNDDLLTKAVRISKRNSPKVRIFFDEMHFAFRDKDSLKSDAALVRDTVLAAQALNERFAEEGIDIVIYLALRREFLDQPEIAQADIVHVIESYGESITWEHYQATVSHPVFDLISLRFRASMREKFSRTDLFSTYLKDIDPIDLLSYTWSKPRDLVRFFKVAQKMYGNTLVIGVNQYKSIIRNYSAQAWRETKSALAAFIPIDAIPELENALKRLIPGQFDGSQKIDDASFKKNMKTTLELCKKSGATYTMDEFVQILYTMGIYYYTYVDANGRLIFQQYHRGNLNPTRVGEIKIHEAVAKALS